MKSIQKIIGGAALKPSVFARASYFTPVVVANQRRFKIDGAGEVAERHVFPMTLRWEGGRNSVGEIDAPRMKVQVSVPPEMKGPGVGTNPDELLLGASATCLVITLAAICERDPALAGIKITSKSTGTVAVSRGGLTYEAMHHSLIVSMADRTPEKEARVVKMTDKAEEMCMISKALHGNVKITYDVKFE